MADRFHRRSIRLRGYDYAQAGAFFVTANTHARMHLFGRIAGGVMHPSPLGALVQRCWDAIPEHMPHVDIGEFVVMPDHVHGIVVIRDVGARHDAPGIGAADPRDHTDTTRHTIPDDPGTGPGGDPDISGTRGPHTGARHDAPLRDPRKPPGIPRGALGQVVASFKSAVTRIAYHDGLLPRGTPVWQRNYYEHIIRDAARYDRIARYIAENPAKWTGGGPATPPC